MKLNEYGISEYAKNPDPLDALPAVLGRPKAGVLHPDAADGVAPARCVVLEGGGRRPGGHGPAHHLPELLGRLHRNLARVPVVIHRKGVRAEYSGRKLGECSAKSLSVKILSFGDETNVRLLLNIWQNH